MSLTRAVRDRPGEPDAPAVASSRGTWSVRELLAAAGRLAGELAALAPAHVPLVSMVHDIAATAVVILAGDQAGRIVVHVDPATPDPPGGLRLTEAPPEAANGGGRPIELRPGHLLLASLRGKAPVTTGVPPAAQVFLTSGSTGVPSGVVRTGAALLADARRVADLLGYRPGQAVVSGAPVFHVYGVNYALIAPLLYGAAVYDCGPHAIPSRLAQAVVRTGAELLIAHPFQYRLLAGMPAADAPAFGPLRLAVSAGAPLAVDDVRVILDRHPFQLWNCYGSSEAGAVTLSPLTGTEPPGDAGDLLPGVSASIAPVNGLDAGELVLHTDGLAVGRLGSGGLTPLADADGGYRTGDLAELAGRRLRLLGRVSAIINVAGKKVSPAEVERVILAHPAVQDAHVRAVPDASRGQIPAASVVARAPLSVAELLEWCRARLAPHQLPRRIDFVAALARSATGKPLATSSDARTGPGAGRGDGR